MSVSEDLALAFSIVALTVSTYLAVRQISIQRKANYVPAVVQVLNEFRSNQIHESFEYVYENLGSHDPEAGLSGLPAEVRYHVFNVCYFLQQVAVLMILDIIATRPFLAMFRARAIATWEAVEPFVAKERETNPRLGPEFLSIVGTFATKARMIDPEIGQKILRGWLRRRV